ncbi:MAG: cyclic nucleotide-binding domain-containing protein [Alphaproteobacteria bacterium]
MMVPAAAEFDRGNSRRVGAMKRHFDAGEVIFREGEVSLSVYVVASGEVEICKETPRGHVTLAILGKGEMFGEMGAIDKSTRNADARANTDVSVEVLSRAEFLHQLETRPGMAVKIIEMMVARRRATEALLWQAHEGGPLPISAGPAVRPRRKSGGGLFARIFGRRKGRDGEKPAVPEKTGPLLVLLAGISGDLEGGMVGRRLQAALDQLPGAVVRSLGQQVGGADLPVAEGDGPDSRLVAAAALGRRLLARAGGDLLLWGEVEADGRLVELRLQSAVYDDRPGGSSPELVLNLPVEFDEGWVFVLRGAVLAALDPRNEAQGALIRAGLAEAVEQARPLVEGGLTGFTATEQASVMIACGNAAAALGNLDQQTADAYHAAITLYRKAVRFLSGPIDRPWGLLHRLLGLAFQAAGERLDDPDLLERAGDAYRSACQAITRENSPREWAILQSRLGVVLYRLDLKTGRAAPLKEALAAFQGALQIVTRNEDPVRWAEIMNNLAQALQVYGDHVRSVEVLERAVDACRAAIEVRTQEAAPLLWAASQNNMGSALFLLARHAGDSDYLLQAVEAFRGALSVYEIHGAVKMAGVTEKNLAHAERLLSTQSRRKVARVSWANDDRRQQPGSQVEASPPARVTGVRLRAERRSPDPDAEG